MHTINMLNLAILKSRLSNYRPSDEPWKKETDLSKCTAIEKREMAKYGVTYGQLMELGLNRGEVAHILFGYRYTKER